MPCQQSVTPAGLSYRLILGPDHHLLCETHVWVLSVTGVDSVSDAQAVYKHGLLHGIHAVFV